MTKKILSLIVFVASVAACTDDYKDWVSPQVVPQPETVSFGNGSVTAVGVIDLNNVTTEQVQVCSITAPTATDEAYKTASYMLTLGNEDFEIGADGMIAAADLQSYLEKVYTCNPIQRNIDATVSMWISNGISTVKTATSGIFQVKAIPQAPVIEKAYYLTGSINGWNNTDTTYKLTNDGSDPYTNPVFTLRIPAPEDGSNVEFKMTRTQAATWSFKLLRVLLITISPLTCWSRPGKPRPSCSTLRRPTT